MAGGEKREEALNTPDHCAYTGDLCRRDVQQNQKSRVHWKEEVEERGGQVVQSLEIALGNKKVNNKDWKTCGAGKEAKRDDRDRHCQVISISVTDDTNKTITYRHKGGNFSVEILTFLKILVVPLSRIIIGATVAIYSVSRS
ncbi:hypothetical protein IAS59_005041 [Cryptococcus gattii]